MVMEVQGIDLMCCTTIKKSYHFQIGNKPDAIIFTSGYYETRI